MIELERWEPTPEDPRRMRYAGQRTAQEVFEELRQRLENIGYLPDEYFILGADWENGREIPRGASVFCTTDYGRSEGIYLDVYLKWYENDRPVTKGFITGKTLQETGDAMDRMYLIASAITKALYGEEAVHSRYTRLWRRCYDSIADNGRQMGLLGMGIRPASFSGTDTEAAPVLCRLKCRLRAATGGERPNMDDSWRGNTGIFRRPKSKREKGPGLLKHPGPGSQRPAEPTAQGVAGFTQAA